MNYRKFYAEQLNITIPEDYDIHHIDFNHFNNDLNNLVALPRELHSRLHQAYRDYIQSIDYIDLKHITLHTGKINATTKALDDLYNYLAVVEECTYYMNGKEWSLVVNGKQRL